MTARANIHQADIERVLKAVKAAGWKRARIVIDLNARTIEAELGDSDRLDDDEWSDDD